MADAWQGTHDATRFPDRAMQIDKEGLLGQKIYGGLSEDCLFLNIYTPAERTSVLNPVMIWIHGGGFQRVAVPMNMTVQYWHPRVMWSS